MNALKGYDNDLQDVAHISIIHDFFLRSRVFTGTCGNCGARQALALCWDGTELAVCDGCGGEEVQA